MVKFLQINLSVSPRALDMAMQNASTLTGLKSDILILSEIPKNAAPSLSSPSRDARSAIHITNPLLRYSTLPSSHSAAAVEVGDFLLISVYISPNCSVDEYDSFLDDLDHIVTSSSKSQLVLAGDFNAAHPSWGNMRPCHKGDSLFRWASQHDLILANYPALTYQGPVHGSTIDLTFLSPPLIPRLQNWKVWDNQESLSDHYYISFEILDSAPVSNPPPSLIPRVNLERLAKIYAHRPITRSAALPAAVSTYIQDACARSSRRPATQSPQHSPKYWWSPRVAEARRLCLKARRAFTRARPGPHLDRIDALRASYYHSKANLRALITKSKSDHWNALLDELDAGQHPFGKAYKIVTNKLRRPRPAMSPEESQQVISALFPRRPPPAPLSFTPEVDLQFDPVARSDIQYALSRLKPRKAPGPDLIPTEAVRLFLRKFPAVFATMMDHIFSSGIWPHS